MVLDICMEQKEERKHTKTSAPIVGITPDRANVAGRFTIAGPVKEFTAIDMDPSHPMDPV
jgi:hypothetical protein